MISEFSLIFIVISSLHKYFLCGPGFYADQCRSISFEEEVADRVSGAVREPVDGLLAGSLVRPLAVPCVEIPN